MVQSGQPTPQHAHRDPSGQPQPKVASALATVPGVLLSLKQAETKAARAAEAAGAVIHERTEAHSVTDGLVKTTQGQIQADHLVEGVLEAKRPAGPGVPPTPMALRNLSDRVMAEFAALYSDSSDDTTDLADLPDQQVQLNFN